MRENPLGRSGLMVSEVGFGCMSLPADYGESERLLGRAFELGVTFFDTADLYGRGENERVVGRALKGVRDEVVIATKVGNRWEGGAEGWRWDPSPAYIRQAVGESLKRLGTDRIDLYQLHGGTLEDPIDDIVAVFEDLQREGLIRAYGISSIRPSVIRAWLARSRMASVMMQLSLLDRRPEEAVLDPLHAEDVAVIARGPLAKGWLVGRVRDGEGFLDYTPEDIEEVVGALETFTGPARSLSQLALRYALAHPAVATVIPGASNLAQLLENAGAARSPVLGEDELERLRALTRANRYDAHR